MLKIPYRERIALVRIVVESMPVDGVDRMVSVRYMMNYNDLDIRSELAITKYALMESRKRIKELLVSAGIKE